MDSLDFFEAQSLFTENTWWLRVAMMTNHYNIWESRDGACTINLFDNDYASFKL